MVALCKQTCRLEPTAARPVAVLANCYLTSVSELLGGYTLILLHGTGLCKEIWEPTLESVFAIAPPGLIRDAWAIEWPEHGDSGVLNEAALAKREYDNWDMSLWKTCVYDFLTTYPGVDFKSKSRSLVLVGHSIGGTCGVLVHEMEPRIQFQRVIMHEPSISPNSPERRMVGKMLTAFYWTRRDVWASHDVAIKEISANPSFHSWDRRVLDIYFEHTLRAHPAAKYPPPFTFKGVTTVLSKEAENAITRADEPVGASLAALQAMVHTTPTTLIYGEIDDLFPSASKNTQRELVKNSLATVIRMPDVGHMAMQQDPAAFARVLVNALQAPTKPTHAKL